MTHCPHCRLHERLSRPATGRGPLIRNHGLARRGKAWQGGTGQGRARQDKAGRGEASQDKVATAYAKYRKRWNVNGRAGHGETGRINASQGFKQATKDLINDPLPPLPHG